MLPSGRLTGIRVRRYRYILFTVIWGPAGSTAEPQFFQTLKRLCENSVGQPAAEIGLRVFDYTESTVIVRCSQAYREQVLKVVASLQEINGHPVQMASQKTSGTLRSLRPSH